MAISIFAKRAYLNTKPSQPFEYNGTKPVLDATGDFQFEGKPYLDICDNIKYIVLIPQQHCNYERKKLESYIKV